MRLGIKWACWPLICVVIAISSPFSLAADKEMDSREMRALLKQKEKEAAQDASDGWVMSDDESIAVDERIVRGEWNKVPFRTDFFYYEGDRLKEMWPELMRAMRVPYPSAEYLKKRIEFFPELKEELGPSFKGTDEDYQNLSEAILESWRLFFSGEFRKAKDRGEQLGAFGKLPAYLSQIIYAVYLSENMDEKHQLLQDVINQTKDYVSILKELEDVPEFHDDYVTLRMGYAFAVARIAEEVPVPVAIWRNYFFKVKSAIDDVREKDPDHPVALAFRAAMDSNLIRVVGKFLGFVTFGARESRSEEYFERSFELIDDLAIVHLEYANGLIYMNRKRGVDDALKHFDIAINIHPIQAMEALDSMYAAKRKREIMDFMDYGRSFRSYERKRIDYREETGENLYNVLKPPFMVTSYVAQN